MSASDIPIPSGASYPPRSGEYGYYCARTGLGSFLMPDERKVVTYSVKQRQPVAPWVMYQGIVPQEFDRGSLTVEAQRHLLETSAARME